MIESLLMFTGFVILFSGFVGYSLYKDALHPAVVCMPTLLLGYVVWPYVLGIESNIIRLFGEESYFYVASLYAITLFAFFLGLLIPPKKSQAVLIKAKGRGIRIAMDWDHVTRHRVFLLALLLGGIAVFTYWYRVWLGGGFYEIYNSAKGSADSGSGYINEAVLLCFPAVLALALSVQGKKIEVRHVLLVLVIISPQILQGTFGGRRGPLFLACSTLFFSWFVARGRLPKLTTLVSGLLFMVFVIVLVWSQRKFVYLGSEDQFDFGRIEDIFEPEIPENNDYVAGVADVLTTRFHGDYYNGYRFLVTVFIRPIPRQIWPTKYEDVGAYWVNQFDELEGGQQFLMAVGFIPPLGSAVGFVADLYHEFYWFAVPVCFILGAGFAWFWKQHRLKGGLWSIVFMEMMILTIYLPTQSFSAWFHRFLFMAFFSSVVWGLFVPGQRRRAQLRAQELEDRAIELEQLTPGSRSNLPWPPRA